MWNIVHTKNIIHISYNTENVFSKTPTKSTEIVDLNKAIKGKAIPVTGRGGLLQDIKAPTEISHCIQEHIGIGRAGQLEWLSPGLSSGMLTPCNVG
jgi:hypothetical protein